MEIEAQRLLLFQESKLLIAALRLTFRLSPDSLFEFTTPFCFHTDCNQVRHPLQLIIFSDCFVISSYSEGGIWARCLAGWKAGMLTILWRAKLRKKRLNELSAWGDAQPAVLAALVCNQPAPPQPRILIWWVKSEACNCYYRFEHPVKMF